MRLLSNPRLRRLRHRADQRFVTGIEAPPASISLCESHHVVSMLKWRECRRQVCEVGNNAVSRHGPSVQAATTVWVEQNKLPLPWCNASHQNVAAKKSPVHHAGLVHFSYGFGERLGEAPSVLPGERFIRRVPYRQPIERDRVPLGFGDQNARAQKSPPPLLRVRDRTDRPDAPRAHGLQKRELKPCATRPKQRSAKHSSQSRPPASIAVALDEDRRRGAV